MDSFTRVLFLIIAIIESLSRLNEKRFHSTFGAPVTTASSWRNGAISHGASPTAW
jgi:hypothetical protein